MSRRDYSEALDRALRFEAQLGESFWRNIVLDHGREFAETEMMYELACIDADKMRREREAAEEEERRAKEQIHQPHLDAHMETRRELIKRGIITEKLHQADADFLATAEENGLDASWFEPEIFKLQKLELFWAEQHRWMAERRRRELEEGALCAKRKDEAMQRAIDRALEKYARVERSILEGIILDILQSGVLNGRK